MSIGKNVDRYECRSVQMSIGTNVDRYKFRSGSISKKTPAPKKKTGLQSTKNSANLFDCMPFFFCKQALFFLNARPLPACSFIKSGAWSFRSSNEFRLRFPVLEFLTVYGNRISASSDSFIEFALNIMIPNVGRCFF